MTKDRRTEKRVAILHALYKSGLTQTAFCERHGIALSTLHYWLEREWNKFWAQRSTDMVPVGTVRSVAGNKLLRPIAVGGITIEVERPVSESAK